MNNQQQNQTSYTEIRQIVVDAISPLKEQLDRIYESLGKEFVRKDVYDAQQTAFNADYTEFKNEMRGKSQRLLVSTASVLGLIVTIFTILQFLHIFH